MLSDIHFEPFYDPSKVAALRRLPIEQWETVLSAPDSPTRAADFAGLQTTCHGGRLDTPWPLLSASLRSQQNVVKSPSFVTVSGDLAAHAFECKYKTLSPGEEGEYSAFSAKTVAFVSLMLHRAFPKSPVYFVLGNNDSGCGHARDSFNSAYLHATASIFAKAALDPANGLAIQKDFPQLGDYNVKLPSPMINTRLIGLQNIFSSTGFTNCEGKLSRDEAKMQIDWLQDQLAAARLHHEHVWILAHMPPGVSAVETVGDPRDLCQGREAKSFLNEDFADTLLKFADVVQLAIFGHTHMDEIRLLSATDQGVDHRIPVKITPAMSQGGGNGSAFVVAQANPHTALLKDYEVYGTSPKEQSYRWDLQYQFTRLYHVEDFSVKSLQGLIQIFMEDKIASSDATTAYIRNYSTANPDGFAASMHGVSQPLAWHSYACSMENSKQATYRQCVCSR
jgi:sphingomyelin phosphodiesterase acid-like 3